MQIQVQPDYLIFADEAKTGELTDFPNIARGWGVTIDQTQSKPPMEWMNGAFNRIDKNTLYLLQQGIPEWHKTVLYPINAVIKYKGILYQAIIENDNAIPTTNTTKWRKLIEEASLSQKGIVQLSSAIDSDSETMAATSKAVKEVAERVNNALPLTGGTVTGDTNFTGKLQQDGSDVATVENMPKLIVLYPNGTAEVPYSIGGSERLVISNPFHGSEVIVFIELFVNGEWGRIDNVVRGTSTNTTDGFGIKAGVLTDKIIIQTGNRGILIRSVADGNPFGLENDEQNIKRLFRLKVVKLC